MDVLMTKRQASTTHSANRMRWASIQKIALPKTESPKPRRAAAILWPFSAETRCLSASKAASTSNNSRYEGIVARKLTLRKKGSLSPDGRAAWAISVSSRAESATHSNGRMLRMPDFANRAAELPCVSGTLFSFTRFLPGKTCGQRRSRNFGCASGSESRPAQARRTTSRAWGGKGSMR